MQNKDVVGRLWNRLPTWVLVLLTLVFCGPVAFKKAMEARKNHTKNESKILGSIGVASLGAWLGSVLTLLGYWRVPFIDSNVNGGIVMATISVALGALLFVGFLVFSSEGEKEDDYYCSVPPTPFVDEMAGYPGDQASGLRSQVDEFSKRAQAEAAFRNGTSNPRSAATWA